MLNRLGLWGHRSGNPRRANPLKSSAKWPLYRPSSLPREPGLQWPACSHRHSCWGCSAFTSEHVTGPRPWPPQHRSQRVLVSTKAVCHHHLRPTRRQLRLQRLTASPTPSLPHSSPKQFPALAPTLYPWIQHRRNREALFTATSVEAQPSHFYFLKGVSLLKVCQNREGFLLGSARAKTCC